MAIASRD